MFGSDYFQRLSSGEREAYLLDGSRISYRGLRTGPQMQEREGQLLIDSYGTRLTRFVVLSTSNVTVVQFTSVNFHFRYLHNLNHLLEETLLA